MLKKGYQASICVAVCIIINCILKYLCALASLPLWMDAFGTILSAYLLGPFSGAVVGASTNIIYNFAHPASLFYLIPSILVGLLIGLYARKGCFEKAFDTIAACSVVTVVSAIASTIINCILYDGSCGNLWGNGILHMLMEYGVPREISSLIAEFFLDFLDKFITMMTLFLLIHLVRKSRKHMPSNGTPGNMERAGRTGVLSIALCMLATMTLTATVHTLPVYASIQSQNTDTAPSILSVLSKNNSPDKAVTLTAANHSDSTEVVELSKENNTSSLVSDQTTPTTSDTTNQTPNYAQYIRTVYSSDNGLLSGEANDIASTDDGIIWIGTYAGLYRYSGSEFRYMDAFDKVKNVNCLFVDIEGRLWIGTNDDGLSICIDDKIVNTFDEDHGFPSNSVRSITQGTDGNFYVGTSDELTVLTLTGGSKIVKTYPEITYAADVTADTAGNVVALTASGELFLLDADGIYQSISHPQNGYFTCCEFSDDGRLFVGTDSEDIYIYKITDHAFSLQNCIRAEGLDSMNSINQLENGCLVLCSDNEIAWFDRNLSLHPINSGEFNSSIDHMTADYQGNLWFSSSRLGVMKLCSSAFTELYPKSGLESKVVNTVAEWNGLLYFGTDSGLDIINRENDAIVSNTLSDLLDNCRIRCLLTDSRNRLWLCAYGKGMICADAPDHYTVYSTDNGLLGTKPRSILELTDGTIAVSSELGISLIRDNGIVKTIGQSDGLSNSLVLSMIETADHKILAGTDGGGISVIENGSITNTLTRKDGLSSGVILRMVHDHDNANIFIITSNGICYYEPEKGIRLLTSFPYSNNYDLLDMGNGKLYVTGSAGIYIVDKKELLSGKLVNYENLNYLSGLRGTFTANAWNYLDQDHAWYIAGGSGVTKFDFDTYRSQERGSYRMLLNTIKLDATVHTLDNETVISIPSGTTSVDLSPEIINYSSKEPYVCYYLEGYDDDKKTILLQKDLGKITYSGLDSGTYRFHLAILDGPNGKTVEELVYTLEKEAEIYEHPWFKLFFFSELILIVAWFSWFFTRKWTARTLELQKKEIALAKEQIRMGNETILAIAKTVDAKDGNTSQHSVRVSKYSCMIARELGYSDEDLENLRRAALLHDIGKIGIPDKVLNKPDRLTDEEYAVMKSHVTVGGDILKDFTLIQHVQEGALYHHERYDGFGYAFGLRGKDIPEIARIIGVADAFDAMTANRVYRKKLSFDIVLEELKKGRGKQFDPDILDIFLGLIEQGEISQEQLYGKEDTNEKV